MRSSDLSRTVQLAYRALVLVESGSSERGAISRAVAEDPSLITIRREGLDLVIRTLTVQDLLDRIINSAVSDRHLAVKTRCLLQVATQLFLDSHDEESMRHTERSIREITSPDHVPDLQLVFATVIAGQQTQQSLSLIDSEQVGLNTHNPVWWVEYCFQLVGRADAIRLLSAHPRPRYVRVNLLRNHGRTSLPSTLKDLGAKLTKVDGEPSIYTLDGPLSTFSKFFDEGIFQIQDMASFLAVRAADPHSGERVLDVCAAPGGKTATLAQFMKNKGAIISIDYSRKRIQSWKREVDRLGVRIAEPVVTDASNHSIRGAFDLILIDPPCSGTGVLDRNPRMKWHLSAELIQRYSMIQQDIIESVVPLLSEEGRVLYCTCSVTREENEDVVSSFLSRHPDFETRPVLENYGTPGLSKFSNCRRLWPHRDGTAGYFVARLQRVE